MNKFYGTVNNGLNPAMSLQKEWIKEGFNPPTSMQENSEQANITPELTQTSQSNVSQSAESENK